MPFQATSILSFLLTQLPLPSLSFDRTAATLSFYWMVSVTRYYLIRNQSHRTGIARLGQARQAGVVFELQSVSGTA